MNTSDVHVERSQYVSLILISYFKQITGGSSCVANELQIKGAYIAINPHDFNDDGKKY